MMANIGQVLFGIGLMLIALAAILDNSRSQRWRTRTREEQHERRNE